MAEGTRDLFFYCERSCINPTTEIDIQRVNIRPRKFVLFYWIDKFWSIHYDKKHNKIKIRYNLTKKKKNDIYIIYKLNPCLIIYLNI